MASNTLPNGQERLSEPQRQQKFLYHFRTGRLANVSPCLLSSTLYNLRSKQGRESRLAE